jgi:outer membrane protein assembly factor BamD
MTFHKNFLATILGLFLVSCGTPVKQEHIERSASELYNDGVLALEKRSWEEATNFFGEVERQHPYSQWATKSQLMTGFAYYQSNNYSSAIISLNRFIQLYPGNKSIDYAYYLRALCYYEQISDVSRDQLFTTRALEALREVIKKFPKTKYARDASLKIDLTNDHLAGKEMTVGRYYQKSAHYLAAINRFKEVIKKYQTTSHAAEALHRLAECYIAVGMQEEARKVAAVLGYNYPDSEWYADTYALVTGKKKSVVKNNSGILRRTWNSLF